MPSSSLSMSSRKTPNNYGERRPEELALCLPLALLGLPGDVRFRAGSRGQSRHQFVLTEGGVEYAAHPTFQLSTARGIGAIPPRGAAGHPVALAKRVRFRTRLFLSNCHVWLLTLCTKLQKYRAPEKAGPTENRTRPSTIREVQRTPPKCRRDKPKLAGSSAAENGGSSGQWRREWDSNPRYGFPYTRFPSERLQPLGHPSAGRGRQYSRGRQADNPQTPAGAPV